MPAKNPFISSGTALHEIYAYGLRNPFRFSFDAPTARLIVGDVGQNNIEEVDFVEAGKNYGWNRKEGSFLFNPSDGTITPDPSPDPALTDPVLEYSHEDGSAIIGGFVEHGSGVPALSGQYVFGDFIAPGHRERTLVLFRVLRRDSSRNCASAILRGISEFFSKGSVRTITAMSTLWATGRRWGFRLQTCFDPGQPRHPQSLDAIECGDR